MNYDEYEVPIQKGLLKPTLLITFFSMIGIVVSFFTQIVLAAKFGAKIEMDSYLAAVGVPQFITAVLLGTLNVTFIPIFIEYQTQKSRDEVWKVASIVTNLTFLILLFVSFFGCVFAPQLISITAPGFKGETFSLTVSLVRIILPSIIFGGLNSLLSSIYYAHHQFFRPATALVINVVTILLFVIAFEPLWGIRSVAFGTLVGSIISFLFLIPIFLKTKRYTFSLDFSNKGVIKIIKVMTPLVLAFLFSRATTPIERMIASTLPVGSISYLGYSSKIITILATIATGGISITIFPAMARSWAEKDLAKVREYFAKGVRIIILITFPIAAIFAVLRVPIIQVFLERGRFDHTATLAIANVILIELVWFICGGLGNIVGKGFYISQKTKLAAFLAVIETSTYLCIAYILSKYFSYIGLAIAISATYILGLTISIFVMKKIYQGIKGKRILDGFIKISTAALFSAICTYYSFNLTLFKNNLILQTGIAGVVGFIVYITFVIYIFKLNEAINLKEKIFRKIKGRL